MMKEMLDKIKDITVEGLTSPAFLPRFSKELTSKINSFSEADKPINNKGSVYVKPHYVNGYTTDSGTKVSGYWRDGDGNTNVNLNEEQGGGYFRKL